MEPEDVTLRLLQGEPAEMAALQRVIEGAPLYAELMTGVPPGPADVQSTFTILPEGKSYEDKFVFGVLLGGRMVGCADLVLGYPTADTAYLGLLLISERFQHRGIGQAAYHHLEAFVQGWGTCDRIRLAVVRVNEPVTSFWERLGFRPTGETKPYRYGPVISESILFERALKRAVA